MVLPSHFTRNWFFVLCAFVIIFPQTGRADVLFEGYYKILSAKTPIGYLVQRYATDPKAGTITSIYYLKTNAVGNNVTESLKATATQTFQPISYQYTTQTNAGTKVIDASFKGGKFNYTIAENGKTVTKTEDLGDKSDKIFLSTFVGYVLLNHGYSAGKNYQYEAVAEEDAKLLMGSAKISSSKKLNGVELFTIENSFKNARFDTVVTDKGEAIAFESPGLELAGQLVKDPIEATKGHTVPTKTLQLLFGNVPAGTKNILHSMPKAAATAPATMAPTPVTAPKTETPKGPKGP